MPTCCASGTMPREAKQRSSSRSSGGDSSAAEAVLLAAMACQNLLGGLWLDWGR